MSRKYPAGVGMTPSKTKLGSFVRARRLRLGFRQIPLSDLVGVSQTLISMIEIGTHKYLNQQHLENLAEALQCDPEELRKRMPTKPITQPKTKLANLIQLRKEELGLTLEEFAKKMKMNPRQVRWYWKPRNNNPGIHYCRVKPLANALNLKSSALAEFVGMWAKPTNSKLGQLVRSQRKDLAMSSGELAKKLRVSPQFVSQIELGQCPLIKSDEMIKRLAQVLEIDVSKLKAVRPTRRRLKQPRLGSATLGGFLAIQRLALGLTQREVGRRLKRGTNLVSAIERGRIHPSSNLLNRLAKALDCQIPKELIPAPQERNRNK